MSRFLIYDTPITGLKLITRELLADERGFLQRLYCQGSLDALLLGKTIRQINHTLTRKSGAVRGLHFQHQPHAETKIVTCLKGTVWDVAVDLREGSPTFLQHHAVTLSEDGQQSYLIPEGFAHGFQALTPDCELVYFHTADYNTTAEAGLNAVDPRLGISWPMAITERSMRDDRHPLLTDSFVGIRVK